MAKKKPHSILFVEPSGAGGIAHYTYLLAKTLAQQGVGCHILTGTRWSLPDIEGPARVYRVFNRMATPVIKLLKTCMLIREDVTHVHWQSASHPRMLLMLMRTFPVRTPPWVYTVHNVLPHEAAPASHKIYSKIYKQTQGLIFHTQASRTAFENAFGPPAAQTAVIPMGEYNLLAGETIPLNKGAEHTMLFFGNIRPYKGLDVLLDAMPEVIRAVPPARLIIAGQALEPFDRYAKQIGAYGLEKHIDLRLGYLPDSELRHLFAEALHVPLPYRAIDQSAVLMLALAQGRTVIASRVGGIGEVIQHGRNGLLAEPNDPHALAQRLIEALQNPQQARQMAANAKRDAQTLYSWEQIAQQTAAFYRDLLPNG